MSKISKEEVLKIARLAKLKIDNSQIQAYQEKFEKILEFFSKIDDVIVDSDLVASDTLKSCEAEDIPEDSFDIDQVLKNAADKTENCFVVPRVLRG